MAKIKRALPVKRLLEWTFAEQRASLDLPDDGVERGFGFGAEHVLIQRAKLGTNIDGYGAPPNPHIDAEVIAGIVGRMPRHVATLVARVASSGLEPDWMPGAVAKVAPREWRAGGHERAGRSAKTEKIGIWRERTRKRIPGRLPRYQYETVDHPITVCPVTFDPHPETIKSARAEYMLWARALHDLAAQLSRMILEDHVVGGRVPPLKPWISGMKPKPEPRGPGAHEKGASPDFGGFD